ncbi:uncharacterized protein M421DRAFT_93408 [Didymella exigua CBS 183.55]|uniref:C2H2-type domain-containing protein n=1 Tax=Didymella exigua CBS 183.55 TaxID=1150837 RepID=A0A6A5RJ66_9PLEO|nr:uncharacterized protein M421DRAFT_93408 [Didymella exigua CBS 183.55]KAF1927148.1 hypothetical protein M421DRAFT_93408 [Didymella exigua CBS 183.55]
MMNSAARGYRRGVSTDTPQMSPGFSPYTGFLTPPSPYGGIEERRGSIVSLSASEYSVPTPTSERSPFSEASWQHVPFGGFQTQTMSGLRHALPLGTVGLPMKTPTTEYDWSVPAGSIEVPMRIPDSMAPSAGYLSSQMNSFSESDHLTPTSTNSNWSFSTAPEHSDLEYGMTGQQTFWQHPVPSAHSIVGQTIAPADAMVGHEDYGLVDDNDSSSFMETEPFDHATFATSPHDNAPMTLPPSPQEVQVKQELEASEAEEKFTRSIHVSPKGGKTVKKERRLNGVSKRRGSKSKSQLVFRRLHDGHIDVEGYEVNPVTGKREPINGPTVEWKYCDWPDCQSRFKRPEHLKRHQRIHLGVKEHECRVEGCPKVFDRRDNYWQHGTTHIRIPGKKDGRNPRLPFSEMIKYADDTKHIEFLEKAYRKACGEDISMESDDESAHIGRKKHSIRCRL